MSETNDERCPIVSVNPETSLASRPNRTFQIAPLINLIAPLCFLFVLGLVLSFLTPHFHDRDNLKQILVQAARHRHPRVRPDRRHHLRQHRPLRGRDDGALRDLRGGRHGEPQRRHTGRGRDRLPRSASLRRAINGLITSLGKIPSFIVTLGSMGIYYGLGGIGLQSQNIGGLPTKFTDFGSAELFGSEGRDGIPYIILVMIAVAIVSHILLTRTRWGRSLFAIGGNQEAARPVGRAPSARRSPASSPSPACSPGIAALVNVARSSVAAHDAGTGYELYAVAATVIGGTSLFGGQGGVIGTIIGALLMFTIRNGCALMNIKPEVERAVIGTVVILAVLYDRYGQPFFRRLLAKKEGAGGALSFWVKAILAALLAGARDRATSRRAELAAAGRAERHLASRDRQRAFRMERCAQ